VEIHPRNKVAVCFWFKGCHVMVSHLTEIEYIFVTVWLLPAIMNHSTAFF
jgi:hypothetical protein